MSTKNRPTPEFIEFLKRSGSSDKIVAVAAQREIAKALESSFSSNSLSGVEVNSSDMNSDIHASSEYRASLVVTQAKKAVESC